MGKKQLRILLVDDNDVTRSLLRGMLRGEEAYDVVGEARNGDQGLEMAARVQPDIICLDIEMPGKNGIDVLPSLREAVPKAKILMITAHAGREMVQAAIGGGASGYIVKPFNAAKVLDALENAMGKGKAQKT